MRTVTGSLYPFFRLKQADVLSVSWSSDGKWIAYNDSQAVTVLGAEDGTVRTSYNARNLAFAWHPSKHMLVTCIGGDASCWLVPTSQQIMTFRHGEKGPIVFCSWSPDGRWLATSGYEGDPSIQVRNGESGEVVHTLHPWEPFDRYQATLAKAGLPVHTPDFFPINWSPLGQFLAVGQEHKIHVWCPKTGEVVKSFSGKAKMPWSKTQAHVQRIAWSTDEQLLAGAFFQTVEVWDWQHRKKLTSYRRHTDPIVSVQWVPQQPHIVSVSKAQIDVWDPCTGACVVRSPLQIPEIEAFTLLSASFSPDTSKIALLGIYQRAERETESVLWVGSHGIAWD